MIDRSAAANDLPGNRHGELIALTVGTHGSEAFLAMPSGYGSASAG